MQVINRPQIMEEIKLLTSRMPTINRIVPIVRIRSFLVAIIHSLLPVSVLSLFNIWARVKETIDKAGQGLLECEELLLWIKMLTLPELVISAASETNMNITIVYSAYRRFHHFGKTTSSTRQMV